MEPCGCDPETDLGGIGRLYQALKEQRQLLAQGLVVDLGHNLASLPAITQAEQAKEAAIFSGLATVAPDAALATPRDLAYALGQNKLRRPWLLSNLASAKAKTPLMQGVAPFIRAKGSLILGFVDPRGPRSLPLPAKVTKLYAPISATLIKRIKGQLTKVATNQQLIILYDGGDPALAKLRAAFPQALVIRSNRRPNDALADHKERRQPGLLLHQGIYSVPSFGSGILTFGGFQHTPRAKAGGPGLGSGRLGGSLERPRLGKPAFGDAFQGLEVPVIWLGKEYAMQQLNGDPMAAVLAQYRQSTKGAFIADADRKAKARGQSPYAGAEACQSCHPAAYKAYTASAHARAMATLKDKHQHQNGECVSCHVVGYDKPGGYIDERYTPKLANVQCENCHGPRKAHTLNPLAKPHHKPEAAEVCAICHHIPHSSAFSFAKYWPKIAHGKQAVPKPKPKPKSSLEDILKSTKPVLDDPKYREKRQDTPCATGPICAIAKGQKTTYPDSCAAAKAGAAICHQGECFQLCTAQYDPVCGEKSGRFATYGNSCERTRACATPAPASACGMTGQN